MVSGDEGSSGQRNDIIIFISQEEIVNLIVTAVSVMWY